VNPSAIHSGTEGIKGSFAVATVHGDTETAHIKPTKWGLMADAENGRDREKFQEGITQKARSIKIGGKPHQLHSGNPDPILMWKLEGRE
jgi:hypothetical protein